MLRGLSRKRKEAGLTQEELAAALGVSTKTFRRWEHGASYPSYIVDRIAARLNCKPEDLVAATPILRAEQAS